MNIGLAARALGGPGVAPASPLFDVVSGFRTHSRAFSSLPPREAAKVARLARIVAHSFSGAGMPIRTIVLTGHADKDTPRRPDYEHAVALARAHEIRAALANALDALGGRPGTRSYVWPPYWSRIQWVERSAGATRPAIAAPRSELERSLNRRVEVELVPYVEPVRVVPPQARSANAFDFDPAPIPEVFFQPMVDAIIEDFLNRANPHVEFWCVDAVRAMMKWFCDKAKDGTYCVDPMVKGQNPRCPIFREGPDILARKLYCEPLLKDPGCCDATTDEKSCHFALLRCNPLATCPTCDPRKPCPSISCAHCTCAHCVKQIGRYMVLEYQHRPLLDAAAKMAHAVDNGCSVAVSVMSGIADDNIDVTCPLSPRWQKCWEHWLMVIGRVGDAFVFWDSSQASSMVRTSTNGTTYAFGLLFYDAAHDRLTTARNDADLNVDKDGFHARSTRPLQKRFQVNNIFNGLAYKPLKPPSPFDDFA
jgi:hypothetical protein